MSRLRSARTIAAVAPLLLLLAAADTPFSSGLWEIRNLPGVATLDGRALEELPLGPIKIQTICLGPAEASKPITFLTRDLGADCTVKTASLSRGQVQVAGTCPNQLEGPEGSFQLGGKIGAAGYDVDFATTAFGDNGRMTFSGKMTGRRVGSCPRG